MEDFLDLLFEVSNEYRYETLILLQKKPLKISEIANIHHATTQEVSRHLTRLEKNGLCSKDVNGYYKNTPYGLLVITLLEEFQFISKHKSYFRNHVVTQLPTEFVKRLGELSQCSQATNLMEFLYFSELVIQEAKDYIWLCVDQYPLTALGSIINALKRGVKFRVIESNRKESGPNIGIKSYEDTQARIRAKDIPLSEQRVIEKTDFFMILSESRGTVAFPAQEGHFDYIGFTASDEQSLTWYKDLFLNTWDRTEKKGPQIYQTNDKPYVGSQLFKFEKGIVVIEGQNSEIDAQIVQNAADNYDNILLKGTFNFGTSTVNINRSLTIRGEGRKDNTPLTKIYKKGWNFPSIEFDAVFKIIGKDSDITIENIHFTDFNCSCIYGLSGKSLNIKNNMITLRTGFGRGWIFNSFGDTVTGIWIDIPSKNLRKGSDFPGGISIEGNYIDFAYIHPDNLIPQINLTPSTIKTEKQPNLTSHEYYIGMGIYLSNISGKVNVEKNTIHNMNARGIFAIDNLADANICIKQNIIESNIAGSYPFKGLDSGVGILAQSGFLSNNSGFNIEINDNSVEITKPDYCGIGIYGTLIEDKGTSNLFRGSVTNNRIIVNEGLAGIKISSKDFDVNNNKISGEAYFGIQTSNLLKSRSGDSKISYDRIQKNDISELKIRDLTWRIRRNSPT